MIVKKIISAILAVLMLFVCVSAGITTVSAAKKKDEARAIAIVFDNSGSMYAAKNVAWCRATYAMEVFASMLNKGDTLLIYPMWPFEVNGEEYTMENPLKITDSKQSTDIRNIYTPDPKGTPIESLDSAIDGLKQMNVDKKYIIVLTDGDEFYRSNARLGKKESKRQLDEIIQKNAGSDLTMMYLGIGENAIIPDTTESDYFVKKHAKSSANVLSSLTELCNKIFGRDTLPENHRSGKKIDFDISMSKLIVFVQGENISDLKLTDPNGQAMRAVNQSSTQYSTKGNGLYDNVPDSSLQGMMVTFEDCSAGTYTIDFSGKEASIEVYYEPDADLDFVFTDADGNTVDSEALYEGDYKVSFGMKDAKTGQLIESDLLGNPSYKGEYSINDQKNQIVCDGYSGIVEVPLKMNDTFDANLTVTYLSGYSIRKDSTDFGWPFGGIKVAARPAGNLKLEISGGDEVYSLQDLDEGKPYIAEIYYEGSKLVGEELQKVKLEWNPDKSNAEITQEFADDHYNLWLEYKDPANPQNTECGSCTVTIFASYQQEGSDNAQTQKSLTYIIVDDFVPLRLEMIAPDSYITIGELDESNPIVVGLSIGGKKLSSEDFDAVKLNVDCGGIEYMLTPDKESSAYLIKLLPTDNIEEGSYTVSVTAEYTDHIGRVTETDTATTVTLSLIPLWVKWLVSILILLLIAIIIWLWLRTPVLPKKIKPYNISVKVANREMSNLKAAAIYSGRGKKRTIKIKGTGDLQDAYWSATLVPAKDSYRYLPSKKRKAMVLNGTTRASGNVAKIDIGNESFARSKKDGSLYRTSESVKDFRFPQGAISYSGTKDINGRPTKYSVSCDIKFDKK